MAAQVEIQSTVIPAVAPTPTTQVIASPFQFYTSGAENLRVTSFNSLTGVIISVQGRRIDENNQLQWFSFTHVPNTDRTKATSDYPLGKGYILNLVVFASSGSPRVGQTFVQVKVIGGLSGQTYVLGTMLQGYITSSQELAWPGSPIQPSTIGGGYTRTILASNPSFGTDIVEVVPTGARWLLQAFNFTLLTDSTTVIRQAYIALWPGGIQVLDIGAVSTQSSGNNIGYNYVNPGAFFSPSLGTPSQIGILPRDMVLIAGSKISASAIELQPGDWPHSGVYVVEEWLEAQ